MEIRPAETERAHPCPAGMIDVRVQPRLGLDVEPEGPVLDIELRIRGRDADRRRVDSMP